MNDRRSLGTALTAMGMLLLVIVSILLCMPEPFKIPFDIFRIQVITSLIMIDAPQ